MAPVSLDSIDDDIARSLEANTAITPARNVPVVQVLEVEFIVQPLDQISEQSGTLLITEQEDHLLVRPAMGRHSLGRE